MDEILKPINYICKYFSNDELLTMITKYYGKDIVYEKAN